MSFSDTNQKVKHILTRLLQPFRDTGFFDDLTLKRRDASSELFQCTNKTLTLLKRYLEHQYLMSGSLFTSKQALSRLSLSNTYTQDMRSSLLLIYPKFSHDLFTARNQGGFKVSDTNPTFNIVALLKSCV